MELKELKKSMSTLEQVLAKTNTDIKINISASETAQVKILKKFRQSIICCLILAAIFAAMAIGGINQQSFPFGLKMYMVVYLLLGAVWYIFMYFKLRRINIAALTPAKLFSKTARLRLFMLSGEIVFGIGIVILFTLLFPNAWVYNRLGFWAMIAGLIAATIFSVVHYWPQYIKLLRELDSIKN